MKSVLLSLILRLFLLSLFQSGVSADPACIGINGRPVPWFAMIKYPSISGASNPTVQNGKGWAYMDDKHPTWATPSVAIDDPTSPLTATLAPMYSRSASYVTYNDECPSGSKSESRGHTKGTLLLGSNSGVWLIHSVPNFPPDASSGFSYPDPETRYGQSFLCLSMTLDNFQAVGYALEFVYPQICDQSFSSSNYPSLTNLADVLNGGHIRSNPYYSRVPLQTGSLNFTYLAKNGAWGSNLYENLTAEFLQDALKCETWQNGVGKVPSFCAPPYPFEVLNIKQLTFSSEIAWTSSKDHSKWAVAENSQYVCIGGINRMESQTKRGGGTCCFEHGPTWKAFSSLVTQVEPCS